jgi:small subunit ribosomal protein S16
LKPRRIYDNLFAMLKIRLQRVGRKHEPSFRVVLTDSKNSTRSGRFAEILGIYDPRKITESLKIDRIKHWLSVGALPTATVHNLLVKKGIVRGKKIHTSEDFVAKEAPVVEEAPAPVEEATSTPEEAPVVEEAPAPEAPAEETPAA